ncbi:hypothetical protein [Demequina activiva]|uniref:Uncharacterized protein n=1 Tax=Demequina activiva TaxID=1582364 RepID=A0A919Q3Q8_9MICO|nr:hypothetical protein [Demequina activiva]GIG54351.1 hypothetical protein Dac01nite_11030 [Demequina activiva]
MGAEHCSHVDDRAGHEPVRRPSCPIALRTTTMAAMLNGELADHGVYDGFELQWFDDALHGTGMAVLLSRREDRSVDCYVHHDICLDRAMYGIGAGVRTWNRVDLRGAHLEVHADGVSAEVAFLDVDGRQVMIDIDDRDGVARRPAAMLAPVGAGTVRPSSLMLVWMPRFDLVRSAPGRGPVVRIDGEDVALGTLPGARWHGRHLLKYAAPVWPIELCRDGDAPAVSGGQGRACLTGDGRAVKAISAAAEGHAAHIVFDPAFPDLRALDAGQAREGRWTVAVNDVDLTGGVWTATPGPGRTEVHLEVTRSWRPGALPWLMRVVTTLMPVFRRWPRTYAWRATVPDGGGPPHGRWLRTGGQDGTAYRRATRT